MARRKQRKRNGECVYCGKIGNITDDHIPPRCLFPKPWPADFIHVPCCESCNEGFSKDDEYFCSRLSLRAEVADHPEVEKLLPKVLRSFHKSEKKGFNRAFSRSLFIADIVSAGGIFLGNAPAYQVEMRRLYRVIARIVRGLFFREYEYRLPDHYLCNACSESSFSNAKSNDAKARRGFLENMMRDASPKTVGNRVFSYWLQRAPDDPNTTFWLLFFYEEVAFLGTTHPTKKT